jgi:DNA-binding beta-propeller fold protein YncE
VDDKLVAAHFQEPWEIASDGAHTLFVADANVIRAIDQTTGNVTTLAGTYGHPGAVNGVGTGATFSLPSGFAYHSGILYLSDTENLTIRQVDVASQAVTTIAGVAGQRGTTDGPAEQALFGEPEGIALDPSGNYLYISDTDNNLIRVLDLGAMTVTTIAGGGPNVSALTDGTGTDAAFSKPKCMRMDSAGNLYVCDAFNTAVRKVVPDNATGAATVTTVAQFQAVPQGIAIDGDDLLVSLQEQGGENSIIRIATDGTLSTVAGSTASSGFADGVGTTALFNSPAGLFDDGAGNLYIADSGNYVIRKMRIATADVTTYAGALSVGSADGTGSQARFSGPQGLAVSPTTAYVADTGNDTIRAVELSTGKVTTLAGAAGQSGHTDGPVASARFDGPEGLALDSAAQMLYVADTLNRVIRRIDLGKGVVSTLSYTNGPGYDGMDGPCGLALDGSTLYVTDSDDDDVVAIDLQSEQISLVAGQFESAGIANGVGANAAFYTPTGLAADGLGNLFLADNQASTVRKIVVSSATVSTIAGSPNMAGYADGVGAAAFFADPFGATANDLGDLFVADTNNNVVRHVTIGGDAGSATVTTVIGQSAVPGVKLGQLPAQLTLPSAVALTSSGGLLVVSENSVLLAHGP